jgi:ParB-like chromosome segregation protein Spo0J
VTPATPKPRRDDTLIKALVRAHRWRRKIESGQAKSIADLAEQEGVTDAYVCRLLPLTCLAPDIVEAILDGRQPKGLRLAEMLGNGPLTWEAQRGAWASLGTPHRALSARGGGAPSCAGGSSWTIAMTSRQCW